MSRSLKKGPYIDPKLVAKVQKQKATNSRQPIRTWSRRSTISPDFVNHWFEIHNGRSFNKVLVIEDMVGHKLGEFAPTRTFKGHPGNRTSDEAGA